MEIETEGALPLGILPKVAYRQGKIDMAPGDLIVCFEVFEHTMTWPMICRAAHELLGPSGLFVGTWTAVTARAGMRGFDQKVRRLRAGTANAIKAFSTEKL